MSSPLPDKHFNLSKVPSTDDAFSWVTQVERPADRLVMSSLLASFVGDPSELVRLEFGKFDRKSELCLKFRLAACLVSENLYSWHRIAEMLVESDF